MNAPGVAAGAGLRGWPLVHAAFAAMFVAVAAWAVLAWSLTELYADQWRQYLPYLERAFPASAVATDNGHRAVVPSLLRLLENAWLEGNQRLQSILGGVFAIAAVAGLARVTLTDAALDRGRRWALVALAAFAVLWLGNARMLLHGNESTQVHLIILCLVAAAALLSQPRERTASTLTACALALVATFSFGSGIALFPALLVLLAVQRRWRSVALVAAVMAATAVAYLLLPGGDGVRGVLKVEPLTNLRLLATWLASMWHALAAPLVEPDAGQSLPPSLLAWTRPIADAYVGLFGPVAQRPWPFALIGAAGLAWLAVATWQAGRQPRASARTVCVGLAVAWFAVAVGALVALSRSAYFELHPDQVMANRYVPWSCLFWWGVSATLIARRNADVTGAATPMALRSNLAVTGLLLAGLATSVGYGLWARSVQQQVRSDHAGFVAGVVDGGRDLGETVHDEVVRGLPAIRAAGLSAFAWPEARLQGREVSVVGGDPRARVLAETRDAVDNRLGGEAVRIELAVDASSPRPARVVVMSGDRVVGLLVRRRARAPSRYIGYARVSPTQTLHYASLDDAGQLHCWTACTHPPAPP